ncbi:MAG: hypothetical protein ACXAEU_20255, partial [Candidatus Hodarchaeales archaeon]
MFDVLPALNGYGFFFRVLTPFIPTLNGRGFLSYFQQTLKILRSCVRELPPVRDWWLPANPAQPAGIFRASPVLTTGSSRVIGWLLTTSL